MRYLKGFGRETWGERDHLNNNLGVDGRIILKLILNKSFENVNEPLDSIKCDESLY